MEKRKKLVTKVLACSLALSAFIAPYGSYANPIEEHINWSEKANVPEFVSGKLTEPSDHDPEDILFGYIDNKRELFKISGLARNSFVITEEKQDDLGYTFIRLQQVFRGTPVFGATMTAHIDQDGVLTALSGTALPELARSLNHSPQIDEQAAIAIAEGNLIDSLSDTPEYEENPTAELVIFGDGETANYAYKINFLFFYPELGDLDYFVDAITGEVLGIYTNLHTVEPAVGTGIGVLGDEKSLNTSYSEWAESYHLYDQTRPGMIIRTYSARNNADRSLLPGHEIYDIDNRYDLVQHCAAVDAHYYAGVAYDFYKNTFGRDSYDNLGSVLRSTVHYDTNYINAFWYNDQLVFGDGDGILVRELSGSLDVVGHELTHGVNDYSANLTYSNQSGAIDESMADVFGTLIEIDNGVRPDWNIGEDIITPSTPGDAIRSMSDPTLYGQPDHMDEFVVTEIDNGGVHTNSGIPNKAAYLISEGGTHYGISVIGIGRTKLGQIYYRALTQYLTESSTFSHLRSSLKQSAIDLYGANSPEVTMVIAALDAVGIN